MSTESAGPSTVSPEEAPRILVTDGDAEMVERITRMLGERYRFDAATSADEARGKLARQEYELVLCDISIPGERGLGLAEELATKHPETAMVFVSAEDTQEVAERASELGAHGYLVKPFQRGQLLIATMNALKQRELELAQRAHTRSQQEWLQTIIDNAPMPIYAKDRDYRYVIANRRASELAQVDPGGLVGLTDAAISPPESAEHARSTDRFVFESGETYEEPGSRVVGGELRVFWITKFPLRDEHGRIIAVCGISPDITPQRQTASLRDELRETQERAIEELRSSRLETVERLATAIELHDHGTGEHIGRMAVIASFLAHKMGLPDQRVELLRAAAPMHDVGKIGIPEEILSKPAPLTPAERAEMERHAEIGYELFHDSQSELLRLAGTIALTHHERYDGSGYPRGLRGEQIPIEGRIVAVADVLDALLSDRPYRPALSNEQAIALIREGRGSHFDPQLVDLLLKNLDEVLALRG